MNIHVWGSNKHCQISSKGGDVDTIYNPVLFPEAESLNPIAIGEYSYELDIHMHIINLIDINVTTYCTFGHRQLLETVTHLF